MHPLWIILESMQWADTIIITTFTNKLQSIGKVVLVLRQLGDFKDKDIILIDVIPTLKSTQIRFCKIWKVLKIHITEVSIEVWFKNRKTFIHFSFIKIHYLSQNWNIIHCFSFSFSLLCQCKLMKSFWVSLVICSQILNKSILRLQNTLSISLFYRNT